MTANGEGQSSTIETACDQSMGLVIAVSGLPAAGKGEFAAILAATGIPVRSMGDMVRAEVRARGIPEAPHVFGESLRDTRRTR